MVVKKGLSILIALFSCITFVSAASPSIQPIGVEYQTHVQSIGWQSQVSNGAEAGTNGRSLRIEALKINLTGNIPSDAKIIYEAQVQSIGWQSPVSNGQEAGTNGQALRIEALKITLSGMSGYEVQYRAHVQKIGWQNWVTTDNGTSIDKAPLAGTTGQGLRIEALEIRLVAPKTSSSGPTGQSWGSGQYEVGTNLPAGEYVIYSNGGMGSFYLYSNNSGNMDSLINFDLFDDTRTILTVQNGEYLTVNGTMYNYADAAPIFPTNGVYSAGMYKVGTDIPAGQYQLGADLQFGGGWTIYSNSTHEPGSEIGFGMFTGTHTINVTTGEYVEITNCTMKQQ